MPSLSVALALRGMLLAGKKVWLVLGLVIATTGGALTVMATVAEVVIAPWLSVAFTLRL